MNNNCIARPSFSHTISPVKFLHAPMKRSLVLSLLGVVSFGLAAPAQMVNKDSLSLVNKIKVDQEKLTIMKSSVADAEKDKMQTAAQAQESADDNRKAANKLSNDPQDK